MLISMSLKETVIKFHWNRTDNSKLHTTVPNITYMCASHPVELYELIMQYLEEETGLWVFTFYESRGPGPFSDTDQSQIFWKI